MTFTPALIAELARLDTAQVLTLLGEIVEPSIHSPFDLDADFVEELYPVTLAYQDAYKRLACAATGEHDSDSAQWVLADYRYDEALAPVTHLGNGSVGA